jgi:mRNA interferase MazF
LVIHRGGVYWADLGEAAGRRHANRRPVLVIQSGHFNASRLGTTVAAVITSNTRLAAMPGNVFVPAAATGLARDSVVNVAALVTLGQADLGSQTGHLPDALMDEVERGLRRVLAV